MTTADFRIEENEGATTAALTGDWTALGIRRASERLERALAGRPAVRVDLTAVERCDTSGAFGVLRAARAAGRTAEIVAPENLQGLLRLVEEALPSQMAPKPRPRPLHGFFERIGRAVFDAGENVYETMVFNGHLLTSVGRSIVRPERIRWAPVIALAERAGLDAIPIVAATTFFIGAVVALIGANLLRQYGAQYYTVELIGVSVLREFDVLITALLLAGRSASSFTAEIGAMKMNQEIDAMQVIGIDPFDALVFPRFMALLLTIPLLTFVAALAGLFGGLVVCWSSIGIAPAAFVQRLRDNVGLIHFWIGLSKAPVMAVVIAGIGCRQGLAVGGDVESLGRRVTAAVVHAIFAAIMIDALFALIYMKLNL
ncbi:MAG TPA: ABC transporter permease [Caulobacteraceae bacterium]|nr:ABC transporter permease [Caulobacteraceae bacterium]